MQFNVYLTIHLWRRMDTFLDNSDITIIFLYISEGGQYVKN